MASRDLNDLHPDLKLLAISFQGLARQAGIDVLIYCTYRSDEEQAAEYAKGRTAPGKVVTNAKPGASKHNFLLEGKPASKAFDCVPMENGRPQWAPNHKHWKKLGEIGESLGLEWAGKWKSFKEFPHFQLKD